MTTLPTRLLEAAEALAEDLPVGTETPSDLEGDVRLDERDAYCVALMREAAEAYQALAVERDSLRAALQAVRQWDSSTGEHLPGSIVVLMNAANSSAEGESR